MTKNILNRLEKTSNFNSNYVTFQKTRTPSFLQNNSSKMIKNLIESQLNENKNKFVYRTQQETEELYAFKYQKEYYEVIICGYGLDEYTNIYDRIEEMKKVNSFSDYKALVNNWPPNSFKSGVTAHPTDLNLRVIILDIDRKLKNICFILNHQKKECIKQHCCLKCANHSHSVDMCKSQFEKCINCLGPHKSYSDCCENFSRKKLKVNRFILKILLDFQTEKNYQLAKKVETVLTDKMQQHELRLKHIEQANNIRTENIKEIRESLTMINKNI
ncbi:unnamed protein product [Brachionus calyciflorus]|uniref:Uncharacterized protein n=1 Tax=Brachionus calyciflorus TaxID=104777 RepID=A0A813M919_9BILA|nr:unnamed protein product [Brachionus calyciflorus]